MAATATSFKEDGTTELTFADGATIRAPSALLYDAYGNPLLTGPAATGNAAAGALGTIPLTYNGSTFDALKDANTAQAGAGAGVAAVGVMLRGSSAFRYLRGVVDDTDADAGFFTAAVGPQLFNGTTWDRFANNLALSLLASAARTGATQSADQTNFNARGVLVTLNVTVASGTGGLTLTIQGKDPVSGTYYNLTANPTAVTGTGLTVYELYPGDGAASGGVTQRTSGPLPRIWRASVAVGDSSSYTYSVGASLIL